MIDAPLGNQKLNKRCARTLQKIFYCLLVCSVLHPPAAAQTVPPSSPQNQQGLSFSLKREVGAAPQSAKNYQPIGGKGRMQWFASSTIGPSSVVGGVFAAGLGTAIDAPSEYGPHWAGFGKRNGMRLTGVSIGNAMEAILGSWMGEDPRYFHTVHCSFGRRVENIEDLTFRAYHPDGQRHWAVARYIATFGNNFLSNTWRVDSEADWQHAMIRTAEGFGARALSNTFSEFVPQIWRKIRHRPDPFPSSFQAP